MLVWTAAYVQSVDSLTKHKICQFNPETFNRGTDSNDQVQEALKEAPVDNATENTNEPPKAPESSGKKVSKL